MGVALINDDLEVVHYFLVEDVDEVDLECFMALEFPGQDYVLYK